LSAAIFQRNEKSGETGSWLFVGEVEWGQAERYLWEVDPIDQIGVSSFQPTSANPTSSLTLSGTQMSHIEQARIQEQMLLKGCE